MSSQSVVHIDTFAMPWEENPGIRGRLRKLLMVDTETRAFVQMNSTGPGFGAVTGERLKKLGPRRHYHRTVNERHYWLSGDYPAWRWKNPQDIDGELTIFHRNGYLENPPGAIHGIRPETTPVAGSLLIMWATGAGTGIDEPEAAQETAHVSFDGHDFNQHNGPFAVPRFFQAEDLPWQRHPRIATWKTKHISDGIPLSPTASLTSVPADATVGPDVSIPGDRLRWVFLLSGDLTVQVTEGTKTERFKLNEGGFLAWKPGATLSYPEGPASEGGCIALCIGHDLTRGVS